MPIRRVGRPGLIGVAARTAVVAGTASAVQSNVANRQQAAHTQQEQLAYEAARAQAAAAPPPATPSPVPTAPDLTAELSKVAALHASGVLTDEEFAAAKARILE